MKAQHTSSDNTTQHTFQITHEGLTYDVVIWLNQKGKFIDDEISLNGDELEDEGEEGKIRESIINYLSENWDSLVDDDY